jgi:hypothetical protein
MLSNSARDIYISNLPGGNLRIYAQRYMPSFSNRQSEFYEITAGIHSWSEFQNFLTNDAFGFGIRDSSGISQNLIERLARALAAKHLFDPRWSSVGGRFATDGGEDNAEIQSEIASYLIDHIAEQQSRFVDKKEMTENEMKRVEEGQLFRVLHGYRESRDPSLEGIRRSQQVIVEEGSRADRIPVEDITDPEIAHSVSRHLRENIYRSQP